MTDGGTLVGLGKKPRRREFIPLLGGAAATGRSRRGRSSQRSGQSSGFLGANNATFERASTDAFVQRLRELNWIENRPVAIEYRRA
jgi:hypothetical protein